MKLINSEQNFIEKDISFVSGGFVLKGKLHLPEAHQPPVVIGSHGLYSSKDSPKQIALAGACNRLGMAYFRFDHRGCGSSQGEFVKVTSLASRCQDLKDAVEAVLKHEDTGRRIGLFGSSMGGTVSLSIAAELGLRILGGITARRFFLTAENALLIFVKNYPGLRIYS